MFFFNDVYSLLTVLGRVRVAVRLRPRNADESVGSDDCVELQPDLSPISKGLRLM